MSKRALCVSLAATAGALFITGFAGDARAQAIPEDGTLHVLPAVTIAGLAADASPSDTTLLETAADPNSGGVQLPISDCTFQLPPGAPAGTDAVDVTLTDGTFQGGDGGVSDVARFMGFTAGSSATITFVSDSTALLPTAVQPFALPPAAERGILGIPSSALTLTCTTGQRIMAQFRSDIEANSQTNSDRMIVRSLPPAATLSSPTSAVPALPPWGIAGLGLLLTGMGVVLVRRQQRSSGGAV